MLLRTANSSWTTDAAAPLSQLPSLNMNDKRLIHRGNRIREQVLGKAHNLNVTGADDSFSRPIRDFTAKYVWGEVWGRKGLPRRTRCLINVALLTALKSPEELKTHIRGARINGCTKTEIREVLLQSAVYCGVPAVRVAIRCAQEVFASEKGSSKRKSGRQLRA